MSTTLVPSIRSVELFALRTTFDPPILDSRSRISAKEVLLVRIVDSEGQHGWGEIAVFGAVSAVAIAVVKDALWPLLYGAPAEPRYVAERLRRVSAHYGQGGIVVSCVSGLELALWDALSRRAGLPLVNLLGGVSEPVRVYASTGYYVEGRSASETDVLTEQFAAFDATDYSGVKIKVGRSGRDVERAQLARVAARDGFVVLDANNAFAFDEAILFGHKVAAVEPLFVEEPIEWGNPTVAGRLAQRCPVPVGGYELEQTVERWLPYFEHGALSYAQPDATWSGGLGCCLEIAYAAARHSVRLIPHNMGSTVATAFNAALVALAPTGHALELDATGHELTWLPGCEQLRPSDGVLRISPEIGIGIDPDLGYLHGSAFLTIVLDGTDA